MSHLETLIPFGLPPAELASDLLRELAAPSLATLISRGSLAQPVHAETTEAFSRALPHEAWLSQRVGLGHQFEQGGSPPIASLLMQAQGLPMQEGRWFVLQPVHIHIARDHLVLTDPGQLMLDANDELTLFNIAASLFREADMPLLHGDQNIWFLGANDWHGLITSSPDAASGHNIDIWMPKGPHERAWRKLQNEVQMHWFDHAINRAREERGLKAVNSIWLWGGANATAADSIFSHAFNLSGWTQAFGRYAEKLGHARTAADVISARPASGLAILDDLLAPALSNDWAQWLTNMHALETEWFAPLMKAVKSGALDRLTLVFNDGSRLSQFSVTRASLRKFWVAPTLSKLVP